MIGYLFVTELVAESLLPGRLPLASFPLVDQPWIQQQIELLVEHGVTELHVMTLSGRDHLRSLLGDGARWGCRLTIQALSLDRPLACWENLPSREEPVVVLLAESVVRVEAPFTAPQLWVTDEGSWAGLAVVSAEQLRQLPKILWPEKLGMVLQGSLPGGGQGQPRVSGFSAFLDLQRRELERRFQGKPHIARSARVHRSARLSEAVWVGPGCHVGAGVELGPNVCLGAGCVVERGTVLREALVTPGSYIGADLDLNQAVVDRSRFVSLRQQIGISIEEDFLLGKTGYLRVA